MKIYVGAYKKYNSGNLAGTWLDLSDYDTAEDFIDACKNLHTDELDPELMFQDFDDIHKTYCSECIDMQEVYQYVNACTDSSRDIIDAGLDCEIPLDSIMDAYIGTYDSDGAFAYDMATQFGDFTLSDEWPLYCIDWAAAARELMFDNVESNGHYFNCHY